MIHELQNSNGDKLISQSNIMKEVFDFYRTLYAFSEVENCDLEKWLSPKYVKRLAASDKVKLEGKLTMPEISIALKI